MKVLVLGGSGFVGRSVCEQLVAAGHHVTVPTRRLASAREVMALPLVTVLEGSVWDGPTLAAWMRGQEVVINLIAVLHGDEARMQRTHVDLPRTVAQAARVSGVKRLVHVSALGVSESAPSRYLRSKARGEAALREACGDSVDLRILRPSVIFGAADRFTNLFAKLATVFPVLPLAGANAQLQPVWVEDVAKAVRWLCDSSFEEKTKKRRHPLSIVSYENNSDITIFQAAGPAVMSLAEIVRTVARAGGKSPAVLGLPNALAQAQALVMEWAPGEPLMSRDNLASLGVPNVAQPDLPGLRELGIEPAALEAIAPSYLYAQGPRTPLDAKRRAANR
jgi:uncharacterized protein YbjT (DUF2867 family)